ncbi:glycosyltransferase [Cupriavidus necator]|uniref:Glycosyl transferase, family 2 n=1 Tax=Cupriavidus pinatubonensis (strain JMP 134 / LMG 1197) TaxID=264198 RepID=Q474S7_CUPPJ|nr:glycosyltransferase [Cupriavidus necator]
MQITFSIVSHGQSALLPPLLAQLQVLSESEPFKVIVTENIPDERPILPAHATCPIEWVVNADPKGFGANHNAAFQRCATPLFMVLNPDVRLPVDFGLDALASQVKAHPGVAGPRVLAPDGRVEDSARRVPGVLRLALRRLRRVSAPDYPVTTVTQQVDWIAGMCMLFDSDSFLRVGGFDERYHLYCEDIDICLRLHRRGKAVSWVQSSRVIHDAQRQSHRDWRYLSWHIKSQIKLLTSAAYWGYRLLPAVRQS